MKHCTINFQINHPRYRFHDLILYRKLFSNDSKPYNIILKPIASQKSCLESNYCMLENELELYSAVKTFVRESQYLGFNGQYFLMILIDIIPDLYLYYIILEIVMTLHFCKSLQDMHSKIKNKNYVNLFLNNFLEYTAGYILCTTNNSRSMAYP